MLLYKVIASPHITSNVPCDASESEKARLDALFWGVADNKVVLYRFFLCLATHVQEITPFLFDHQANSISNGLTHAMAKINQVIIGPRFVFMN